MPFFFVANDRTKNIASKFMKKMRNTTPPIVGDSTFSAAQDLFKYATNFEELTGYSVNKANEIIVAGIVNKWLSVNDYNCSIVVNTNLRGVDGEIVGDFGGPVEFKSSKQASPSFQFSPNFSFMDHSCIAMTVFKSGTPTRIFLAIALSKDKKSMETLTKVLQLDSERLTYNENRGDRLCIFATSRKVGKARKKDAPGLKEMVDSNQWSKLDRIVEISGLEINGMLQETE